MQLRYFIGAFLTENSRYLYHQYVRSVHMYVLPVKDSGSQLDSYQHKITHGLDFSFALESHIW